MKYIINIEDEPLVRKSALYGEAAVYKVHGFRSLVFDRNGLDKLTPYDEEEVRKAYQKGLDDAWECAKKINCIPRDGGLSGIELDDIFNMDSNCIIMKEFSASEAMERIKDYKEKQNGIRVGDEVKATLGNAIVTYVTEEVAEYIYWSGTYGGDYLENLERTGRHFGEIETLLEKMRGEELRSEESEDLCTD